MISLKKLVLMGNELTQDFNNELKKFENTIKEKYSVNIRIMAVDPEDKDVISRMKCVTKIVECETVHKREDMCECSICGFDCITLNSSYCGNCGKEIEWH